MDGTLPISTGTVSRADLSRLSQLRPYRWVRDVILDWTWIAAAFAVYAAFESLLLLPLAALVIGSRQHALGLLGHEATHRTAFPNKRSNDVVGALSTAWPLFVLIDHGYRPWHLKHHRWLGTKNDPELGYRGFRPYSLPVTRRKIALWFCLDLVGLGVVDLSKFQREVFPKQVWRLWGPVLWFACLAAVTIWTDSFWIFGLWVWSLVAGFWAVFRVRTWYEHVGLENAGREGSHRFSANPLIRFLFFPHNTHCHYEHHRWPGVPYYNLPGLRALVGGRPVLKAADVFDRFDECDGSVGEAQLRPSRSSHSSLSSDGKTMGAAAHSALERRV